MHPIKRSKIAHNLHWKSHKLMICPHKRLNISYDSHEIRNNNRIRLKCKSIPHKLLNGFYNDCEIRDNNRIHLRCKIIPHKFLWILQSFPLIVVMVILFIIFLKIDSNLVNFNAFCTIKTKQANIDCFTNHLHRLG